MEFPHGRIYRAVYAASDAAVKAAIRRPEKGPCAASIILAAEFYDPRIPSPIATGANDHLHVVGAVFLPDGLSQIAIIDRRKRLHSRDQLVSPFLESGPNFALYVLRNAGNGCVERVGALKLESHVSRRRTSA
jgi:hypothetical protein